MRQPSIVRGAGRAQMPRGNAGYLTGYLKSSDVRVVAMAEGHLMTPAFPSHGRGHRFNPCRAHHISQLNQLLITRLSRSESTRISRISLFIERSSYLTVTSEPFPPAIPCCPAGPSTSSKWIASALGRATPPGRNRHMAIGKTKLDKAKARGWDTLGEESTRRKTHRISKQGLEANPDVKDAYEYYTDCVRDFKLSRNLLIQAKERFQDVLDPILYDKERIERSKFWEFILDVDGNMLYKDSDHSYTAKAKRSQTRFETEKQTKFDDDDLGLGTSEEVKKDTPENQKVVSGGIPKEITDESDSSDFGLPDDFKGNEKQYYAFYRKLKGGEQKHNFFLYILMTDEDRLSFYFGLRPPERTQIYRRLSLEDKKRIDEAEKLVINPPEQAE
jgi:hypothetical protein